MANLVEKTFDWETGKQSYIRAYSSPDLCETIKTAIEKGYKPVDFNQTHEAGQEAHLRLTGEYGFARITSEKLNGHMDYVLYLPTNRTNLNSQRPHLQLVKK